ncbi:hypothetical protein DJ568_08825 [Mucilaginibacter hurinus]|uniref:DUF4136 domain-containing protein n=1 Tax=Mucilaginibacter hurinus TaxID=2201324 RepID=A0A367GQY3_9SPHI|nr:hypothetical protein [Mucilaginibacter hurinus]RCH55276.1 hypothetical protein DJ568_08825 [Mucilaginibacter hurinus]
MRFIALLVPFIVIVFSSNTLAQGWKDGYYYDTTFTKVSGQIKSSEKFIWFKRDKKADKIKIPAYSMNSYVTGADSFIVSRMPEMADIPIIKVLIDNPVKLYTAKKTAKIGWGSVLAGVAIGVGSGVATGVTVMPSFGGGKDIYYLYGYGPESLQSLTRKNFIEVMSGIMSDKPEIVERIKDKRMNINNVHEWVEFYHKEKAAQPLPN